MTPDGHAWRSDLRFLDKRYRREFGIPIDWTQPRRFTELLNWRKLHDRDPRYTRCADKLAVRSFVEEKIGAQHLVPLLAAGRTWREIGYRSLSEPFIVKTNHQSGGSRIVVDRAEENEAELRRRFARQLKKNLYPRFREWHYRDIEPALLVEELLLEEDGRPPCNYKFHCFNYGERIEVIVLVVDDRSGDRRAAYFDEDWNRLPFTWGVLPMETPPERPDCLPELASLARALAEPFRYVRVDLYWVRGRARFGELTFVPNAGFNRFVPDDWDFVLGDKLRRTGILETASEK